jgi:LysM repeat protein
MTFVAGFFRVTCAALLCLGVSGCFPSSHSQLDEEKEPHFLAGKSRENAMDIEGAIQSFQKAVEVNPRSAAAHLELGLLYEKSGRDDTNCAAAIYHFYRYLQLCPQSENAKVIEDHIFACKRELAQTVSFGAGTQDVRRELERLTEENKRYRDEIDALKADRPVPPPTGAGSASNSNGVTRVLGGTTPPPTPTSSRSNSVAGAGRPTSGGTVPAVRTYVVQKNETLAGIARKNGIKLSTLMAANPGIVPEKLRVGRSLNLPPP